MKGPFIPRVPPETTEEDSPLQTVEDEIYPCNSSCYVNDPLGIRNAPGIFSLSAPASFDSPSALGAPRYPRSAPRAFRHPSS